MLSETIHGLWLRIRALFRRRQLERDLDEEIRFHLAMREEKLAESGVAAEEAPHAARRRFGNATRAKETNRELWTFPLVETVWHDIRYGLRQLRRNPGFTLIAIVTLGLGIGANTAIFSAVDSILLRPLPYKDASRLVEIHFHSPSQPRFPFGYSPATSATIRARATAIGDSAVYESGWQTWKIAGRPAVLGFAQVSSRFFRLLGVRPALGRFFSLDEFHAASSQVAVLSYRVWQERFGGVPGVLRQTVSSGGKTYVVVGVAPKGFQFPAAGPLREATRSFGYPTRSDIWIPLVVNAALPQAEQPSVTVVARVRPGASGELRAELDAIAGPLARRNFNFGGTYGVNLAGWELTATSLHDELVGKERRPLLLLFVATVLVLLIAVANVASLQLARLRERSREMGIRTALGATRGRVVRQSLVESCLVAFAGGGVGLLVASAGVAAFRAFAPLSIPRLTQLRPDWIMAGFGLGVSIFAGVLVGLVPAVRFSSLDPNAVLHGGEGRAEAGRGRRSVSRILVIGETALALVLLICSGLLVQSLGRLLRIRLGMRTDHLLTLNAELTGSGYAKSQERIAFFQRALRRIRALPGVRAVAISGAPLLGGATFVEPVLRAGSAQARNWDHRAVSPGYFRTLGIPLLRGRDFNAQDTRKSPHVAVVSEALAQELWGKANPVGREVVAEAKPLWRAEVVGVVADARDNRLRPRTEAELYTALVQRPPTFASFLERAAGSPAALGRELRNGLWSIDPDLLLSNPRSVDAILAERHAEPQFEAWLTAALALLGLALGLVGVYGMFSYSVERRRREIGLRMALGAQKRDVLRLVLGEGLRVVGWGIAIGLAGALAAARLMRGLLYGVSAVDPATFAGLAALLASVCLLACYVPARRAMRVDPVTALKDE